LKTLSVGGITVTFEVKVKITAPGWDFEGGDQGGFADERCDNLAIIAPKGRMKAKAKGTVTGNPTGKVTLGFVQTLYSSTRAIDFQPGLKYTRAGHRVAVPIRDGGADDGSSPWYNPQWVALDSGEELFNPFEPQQKAAKPGVSKTVIDEPNGEHEFRVDCEDQPSFQYPHFGPIQTIKFHDYFTLWLIAKVDKKFFALSRSVWMAKINAKALPLAALQKAKHTRAAFQAKESFDGLYIHENRELNKAFELNGHGQNLVADGPGGAKIVLGGPSAILSSVQFLE